MPQGTFLLLQLAVHLFTAAGLQRRQTDNVSQPQFKAPDQFRGSTFSGMLVYQGNGRKV